MSNDSLKPDSNFKCANTVYVLIGNNIFITKTLYNSTPRDISPLESLNVSCTFFLFLMFYMGIYIIYSM